MGGGGHGHRITGSVGGSGKGGGTQTSFFFVRAPSQTEVLACANFGQGFGWANFGVGHFTGPYVIFAGLVITGRLHFPSGMQLSGHMSFFFIFFFVSFFAFTHLGLFSSHALFLSQPFAQFPSALPVSHMSLTPLQLGGFLPLFDDLPRSQKQTCSFLDRIVRGSNMDGA